MSKHEHVQLNCPHVEDRETPPKQMYNFDYWSLALCIACDRMLKGNLLDYILQMVAHPLIETVLKEQD
jgi:hypothetical protein